MVFILFLSNLFCRFRLQKTYHQVFVESFLSWFRFRSKKASGSRSALKKTPQDPDPQRMNADPQPWYKDLNFLILN